MNTRKTMKRIFLILILLTGISLILSCSSRTDLVGSWHNRYNSWELGNAILWNTGLILNNKLILNQDSTWQLSGTCEILRGSRWKVEDGQLLLIPDTSWGKSSAQLNKSKSELPGFISYAIKHGCLLKRSDAFQRITDSHGNVHTKKSKIFEKLEPYK